MAVWTILLIGVLYKANQKEPISNKKLYIHGFLLWVFLMLFVTSFKMFGWALAHISDISKYFFIKVGIIPDWLNLIMWGISLIFGIIAMFLVYSLAKRKANARQRLLKLLPIFYILTVYEIFKGGMNNEPSYQLIIWMLFFSIFISLILYGSMYFFYKKDDVANEIFIEK